MKKRIIIFRNLPADRHGEILNCYTYIILGKCEEKKRKDMKKVLSCKITIAQTLARRDYAGKMEDIPADAAEKRLTKNDPEICGNGQII